MADGAGSASYGYDDLDEPLSVTTTYTGVPAQTVSYSYFPDGSRRTLTTPAGTFTASYDLAARMTALVNPFAETSSWTYLNNGWLSKQTLGNGAYTQYTNNPRGFATALQSYTSGGAALSQFLSMTYDPVGNRTSMNSSLTGQASYSGVTSYLYDSKNQLTQEQSARIGGYTNPFVYDLAGNPTTFKGATHSFNSDNQDTGIGYNLSGNPTSRSGNTLTFDPANQLTAYGTILTAGYTGDGLRAWKQTSAGRTYFLYDGALPVVELNSSGAATATNTFGPNGLLSRRVGSTSTFYQFDPQGSVAQRLNSAQAVQSSDTYDAYGVGQSTGSNSDPWGYGAQWGYFTDRETGLLLLTHRYYDPAQGRFLTRDPVGPAGGLNLYGYVSNGPVGLVDPQGLAPKPGSFNKLQCLQTLVEIYALTAQLLYEIGKYNPITDGQGGHPFNAGGEEELTKPGGHYKEIQYLRNGVVNRLRDIWDRCNDPDDNNPSPPLDALRAIGRARNLPKPVIPAQSCEAQPSQSGSDWRPGFVIAPPSPGAVRAGGWGTVAVIAYWLLSEGSRLWLPRNFVPWP